MDTKRIYATLTIEQKKKICLRHEEKPKLGQVELGLWAAKEFNLPKPPSQGSISNLLRKKEIFLRSKERDLSLKKKRVFSHPEIEDGLCKWVERQREAGVDITETAIRREGQRLATELGYDQQKSLSFSNGWLYGFKKRMGIVKKCGRSRKGSPDDRLAVVLSNWTLSQPKPSLVTPSSIAIKAQEFISLLGYENDVVFTPTQARKLLQKLGIFGHDRKQVDSRQATSTPTSLATIQGEISILHAKTRPYAPENVFALKDVSIFYAVNPTVESSAHTSITVLLCCNADASIHAPPAIVYEGIQPPVLDAKTLERLGVDTVESNREGVLTPVTFRAWLRRFNDSMAHRGNKVLLCLPRQWNFVTEGLALSFIELTHLPTTHARDPISSSIETTFKRNYYLKHFGNALDIKILGKPNESIYARNVVTTIKWIVSAWHAVDKHWVVTSFDESNVGVNACSILGYKPDWLAEDTRHADFLGVLRLLRKSFSREMVDILLQVSVCPVPTAAHLTNDNFISMSIPPSPPDSHAESHAPPLISMCTDFSETTVRNSSLDEKIQAVHLTCSLLEKEIASRNGQHSNKTLLEVRRLLCELYEIKEATREKCTAENAKSGVI